MGAFTNTENFHTQTARYGHTNISSKRVSNLRHAAQQSIAHPLRQPCRQELGKSLVDDYDDDPEIVL